MKVYGKNVPWWANKDKDLAPKSSIRNLVEKGGNIKNSLRSSKQKRRLRKILKTAERKESKNIIKKELNEYQTDYEKFLEAMNEDWDDFIH